MTTKRQIELETIPFIILIIVISSFLVWESNQNSKMQLSTASPINTSHKTVALAPNPVLKVDTVSEMSPDGTKKLTMKTTHNPDGTLAYLFTSSDQLGANEAQVYTTRLKPPQSISIPFNAWSPDNRYLFIQKENGDALVFKATGEEIVPGQKYFDVGDLFLASSKKDIYQETTGWASPTLLIVNTTTQNNTKGSSYWFEVPSKAIIQLASEF